MSVFKDQYHRLSRKGPYRLYQGPDHLLYVYLGRYREVCKRFYFKDIQALVLTSTRMRRVYLAGWLALAAFFGLSSYLLFGVPHFISYAMAMLLVFFFLVSIVAAVINVLRGPTCNCRLQTAIQEEDLKAINRMEEAESIARHLKPVIMESQGSFEDVRKEEEPQGQPARPVYTSAPPRSYPAVQAPPREIKHEEGRSHQYLFYIILVAAASAAIDLVFQHRIKNLLDTLLLLPLLFFLVRALWKQSGSDLPSPVRRLTWAALGFTGLFFFFSQFYFSIYGVMHQPFNPAPVQPLYFSQTETGPVFLFYLAVKALVFFIIGIFGLIRLWQFRREHEHLKSSGPLPSPVQEESGEQ